MAVPIISPARGAVRIICLPPKQHHARGVPVQEIPAADGTDFVRAEKPRQVSAAQGFSDFIVNYDIKYRMGQKDEAEGEEG